MRTSVLFSSLLAIFLFSTQCAQKGNDYQKEYDDRVLASWFVSNSINPQVACTTSLQKSETCLTKSSNQPFPITEANLSAFYSQNQFTTYSAYCTNLLQSSSFHNFSNAAKACTMDCITSYWQTRTDQNLCSAVFADQLSGVTDGTKACNLNCFKLLNNDVP